MNFTYTESGVRMALDFSWYWKLGTNRKPPKLSEGKNFQDRIPYLVKLAIICEDEIAIFWDTLSEETPGEWVSKEFIEEG